MARFAEVGDRVWVARYPWFDVNVSVVAGDRGAVVVDTHASSLAALEVVDDVRRLLGATSVVAVVNTHEHFDHCFGNGTLLDAFGAVPVHAHEVAAGRMTAAGERVRALYRADPDDPHRDEVLATVVVPADHTFLTRTSLDLGDRTLELVHPGRGHTGGDALVLVPDSDVVLAGDLVEESGPPALGEDSYPLEWPATLDRLLHHVRPTTVVVPGHGAPVDQTFVERQRDDLARVASTIRDLVLSGVEVERALGAAEWPWSRAHLAEAVRTGYAQLGRG